MRVLQSQRLRYLVLERSCRVSVSLSIIQRCAQSLTLETELRRVKFDRHGVNTEGEGVVRRRLVIRYRVRGSGVAHTTARQEQASRRVEGSEGRCREAVGSGGVYMVQ